MTEQNTQQIPKGWEEIPLRELVFPVSDTYDFTNVEKIHFLNTGDILDGKLLHTNLVDTLSLPGQAKKKFLRGDILYSEIRPANKRYMLVDFDSSNSVASTKLMVLRTKNGVDTKFIYQILTAQQTLDEFQFIAESRSGTFPQITFESISFFPILLPSLPEQRAIASVLSAFDDKIELLREQNKTLEAIAQTLFNRWFVEFNFPDENGRPYRESGGKMVDSELGEIPEGWRVGILGDIDFLNFGDGNYSSKYPKQRDFVEKGVPFISNKDIKDGVILSSALRYISLEQHRKLEKGHLKKWDILISTRANIGEIALVPAEHEGSNINAQLVFVRPNMPDIYSVYLYLLFKSKNYKKKFEGFSSGSAQAQLPIHSLKRIPILLPSEVILKKYSSITNVLIDRLEFNFPEIQALSQLRDSILPKLMRGEVRVKGF